MTQIQHVIRRLRASLSQSEIARRTGIAQSKISRWEAGKVAAGAEEALRLVDLAEQLEKGRQAAGHELAGEG